MLPVGYPAKTDRCFAIWAEPRIGSQRVPVMFDGRWLVPVVFANAAQQVMSRGKRRRRRSSAGCEAEYAVAKTTPEGSPRRCSQQASNRLDPSRCLTWVLFLRRARLDRACPRGTWPTRRGRNACAPSIPRTRGSAHPADEGLTEHEYTRPASSCSRTFATPKPTRQSRQLGAAARLPHGVRTP